MGHADTFSVNAALVLDQEIEHNHFLMFIRHWKYDTCCCYR